MNPGTSAVPPVEESRVSPVGGYRCLVVGAARGIGRATVDLLAASGATVAACDLPGAVWTEADPHAPVKRFAIDLTDRNSVTGTVREAVAHLGGLDAVVNCAGVLGAVHPAAQEPVEQFETLLKTNLVGAFLLSREVLPVMAGAGFGRMVHIASIAGKDGNPRMTGYSASKAGLIGMVKALGREYAATGVTVNAVAPAAIDTPLIEAMTPRQRETQRDLIPMGRAGTADEAAALVRFILSRENSFTTGFVYDLSGGRATY